MASKMLLSFGGIEIVMVSVFIFLIASNMKLIERAKLAKEESLSCALSAGDMRLDAEKTLRRLGDVALTESREGFDEAEKHAQAFRGRAEAFRSFYRRKGDADSLGRLEALLASFEGFYDAGEAMAEAYASKGPEAGRPLMARLEPIAASLAASIGEFEQVQVEALEADMDGLIVSVTRTNDLLACSGLFILAATICISLVLGTNLAEPAKKLKRLLARVAGGDLVSRADIKSRDEIGQMGHSLNDALDSVKALVAAASEQAGVLERVGLELSAGMEQTSSSIHEISASIESIRDQALSQSASVNETGAAMHQITQNIEGLDRQIERQAANITESSSAIEEMLANISSVTQTLADNADNMKGLMDASEKGRADLDAVSAAILEIEKESQGLIEISAVIEGIASQTDLLAMNAAIEAAHAGEAGKGFSVVSDEIRKLAESSAGQAKTVTSVLGRIGALVAKISEAAEIVSAQFGDIGARIKSAGERERSIRDAMDEQGAGSKQILEAIAQLNDISAQIKAGSAEMLVGSREVIRESANLNRISEEVKGSMGAMAASVGQIAEAVSEVNEVSRSNKESIAALTGELGRFRIEGGEAPIARFPEAEALAGAVSSLPKAARN